MVMGRRWSVMLLVACLLLVWPAWGQFGGPAPTPSIPAVKSDLPYIRCGVCEALAKNAYRQVKAARDKLKPGKKLGELEVLDIVEQLANPSKDEGEWIAKIDLVESGAKLKLVEQEDIGKCGPECKTVQRAAEDIVGDHDTDIAEKLWQGSQSRAQFSNWLCYELTPSCKKKPPPLPKDRKPGPAFEAIDPQEAQMQKMLAGMKDMGMGGQVYDRATVEKMAAKGDDMFSEDDDEEDEDEEVDEEPNQARTSGAASGAGAAGSVPSAVGSSLGTAKEVLSTARGAAEAAVGQAREGLSKAFSSAKSLVSGLTGRQTGAEEL